MIAEAAISKRKKKIAALARKRQTIEQRLSERKRDLSGMSQWLEQHIIDTQATKAFQRTLRALRREITKLNTQGDDIECRIAELERIIEALTHL